MELNESYVISYYVQKTYDSEKDVGGRDLELCADDGFLALLLLSLGKNVTYFPKTIISCL